MLHRNLIVIFYSLWIEITYNKWIIICYCTILLVSIYLLHVLIEGQINIISLRNVQYCAARRCYSNAHATSAYSVRQ